MPLHILKLCVGVETIEDLAAWQRGRLAYEKKSTGRAALFHTTRMVPKRQDEVLSGGSIYWVIKGVIQVRQRIIGFEQGIKETGVPACLLMLDPKLVTVRPTPRRAFQGWRYLTPGDAPPDLTANAAKSAEAMPPHLRKSLADLGLL